MGKPYSIDLRERVQTEAAGETAQAAHGFPGTWRNASVRTVPRVHVGNVGLNV